MNTKHSLIMGTGALLLWVISYATIIADYPTIYSPFSIPVVVPVLLLSEVFRGEAMVYAAILGTLTIPLLFLAWSFPLCRKQEQIPKRTLAAALTLISLSAFSLLFGWSYGIQYQGMMHTLSMYLYNFCFWAILFFLYRANAKHISFTTNFLFHWTMFAWLCWVAFPWLGELI